MLTKLAKEIHEDNVKAGWWNDPVTGEDLHNNKYALFTKLFLCNSEISEAGEGLRKGINDDHLPQLPMEAVEIADVFIRLLDYCGARDFDIDMLIDMKRDYNRNRADHKLENRGKAGGKLV